MIKSDNKNIEDLKVCGKVGSRLKWNSTKHSLDGWHVGHGIICQVLLLLLYKRSRGILYQKINKNIRYMEESNLFYSM